MITYAIDGVDYEIEPLSPLGRALEACKAAQVTYDEIFASDTVTGYTQTQGQLEALELAAQYTNLDTLEQETQRELQIIALKRRVNRLKPSFDEAQGRLQTAALERNAAEREIGIVEQQIRQVAQQRTQAKHERQEAERRWQERNAQLDQQLAMLTGLVEGTELVRLGDDGFAATVVPDVPFVQPYQEPAHTLGDPVVAPKVIDSNAVLTPEQQRQILASVA